MAGRMVRGEVCKFPTKLLILQSLCLEIALYHIVIISYRSAVCRQPLDGVLQAVVLIYGFAATPVSMGVNGSLYVAEIATHLLSVSPTWKPWTPSPEALGL